MSHPEIEAVLSGASRWCVVEGDCLDVMRELPDGCVDAVVTDPPYGIGDSSPVARPTRALRADGVAPREWDAVAPDISHCLVAPVVAVWGGNYFPLPPSRGWLVWVKLASVPSMASAELCWTNLDQNIRHIELVRGPAQNEREMHPTQKPSRLMRWCIEQLRIPPDSLIIDPYCGSGTTGVAAVQLGHRFIGIEREASYCAIARRRIADAAAQRSLF